MEKKKKSPPAAVSDLQIEHMSHDCATLNWSNGADKDSKVKYKVGYTWVEDSECAGYVIVDKTSCIVDGLSPGTLYTFFVIACNEHGESDRSKEVNGKTLGPPAAVSDLKIEHMSHDRATLNWSNGAGKDSKVRYKVGYTRFEGSECVRYVNVDKTSCIVDCLIPGTQYNFFVIACNEYGESDRSMEVYGKTLELSTNRKESWIWRHRFIIAVIFLVFGVQYLFFGNIDNKKNMLDIKRDLEGRLADFEMAMSTLKKQQINDKGILHDTVKKFKSEMRNKDDEKTKLKELTNKEDSAASDVSSGNEKLNELEEAKATLEFKYKTIEDVDTIKPNTFNKELVFLTIFTFIVFWICYILFKNTEMSNLNSEPVAAGAVDGRKRR